MKSRFTGSKDPLSKPTSKDPLSALTSQNSVEKPELYSIKEMQSQIDKAMEHNSKSIQEQSQSTSEIPSPLIEKKDSEDDKVLFKTFQDQPQTSLENNETMNDQNTSVIKGSYPSQEA